MLPPVTFGANCGNRTRIFTAIKVMFILTLPGMHPLVLLVGAIGLLLLLGQALKNFGVKVLLVAANLTRGRNRPTPADRLMADQWIMTPQTWVRFPHSIPWSRCRPDNGWWNPLSGVGAQGSGQVYGWFGQLSPGRERVGRRLVSNILSPSTPSGRSCVFLLFAYFPFYLIFLVYKTSSPSRQTRNCPRTVYHGSGHGEVGTVRPQDLHNTPGPHHRRERDGLIAAAPSHSPACDLFETTGHRHHRGTKSTPTAKSK